MTPFESKQARLQSLLAEHQLDALLLQRVSSFAWATDGASSYVNTATTTGAASLLVTPTRRYLITNTIEAPRLEHEESLARQGWEFRVGPWYEPDTSIAELTRGSRLGADGPFPGAADLSRDVARLRAALSPEEGERFRHLSGVCAEAMDRAIRAIRPGMTEFEIAALLARETQSRGAQPIVNLIATDDRVFQFRHPLPTSKKLDKYAMLVLCGRKWGLVCSITRLVHFGHLPEELARKAEATAHVDAAFLQETRPGRTIGDVFERATRVYAASGYPNEWHLHHQGGPAGYEPREWLATPGATDIVAVGQAYAWNPSITGTKSEDTILVGEHANEVLTAIDGWPMLTIKAADGRTTARPAILEIT